MCKNYLHCKPKTPFTVLFVCNSLIKKKKRYKIPLPLKKSLYRDLHSLTEISKYKQRQRKIYTYSFDIIYIFPTFHILQGATYKSRYTVKITGTDCVLLRTAGILLGPAKRIKTSNLCLRQRCSRRNRLFHLTPTPCQHPSSISCPCLVPGKTALLSTTEYRGTEKGQQYFFLISSFHHQQS